VHNAFECHQQLHRPQHYAGSIRGAKAELTAVGGQFIGKVVRIDLHALWTQRLSENLPSIMHSGSSNNRAIISFSTQLGPGRVFRSGLELRSTSIARPGVHHSYFQRSTDAVDWGSMSLPVEEMCAVGAAVAGCNLAPPRTS
jgi:hypothetical protein